MKKENFDIKEKKSKAPSKELVEFYKTFEGKILKQIADSTKKKHYLEAYMFSWAMIENVLLPKLIKYIAKRLNISIPKEIWKLNQMSINYIYLSISHDSQLFGYLEQSRKERNSLAHDLVKGDKIKDCTKEAKVSLEFNIDKVIRGLLDRLAGASSIPSLELYPKGWNDALEELKKFVLDYGTETSNIKTIGKK